MSSCKMSSYREELNLKIAQFYAKGLKSSNQSQSGPNRKTEISIEDGYIIRKIPMVAEIKFRTFLNVAPCKALQLHFLT